MTSRDNVYSLPADLPIPKDDGGCDHLPGRALPDIALTSTTGETVGLAELRGTVVLFCYPRTGHPDRAPTAAWNGIPGARGCTPEACGFRDGFHGFTRLGVTLYGVSTQPSAAQREAVDRLGLPYPLLSDDQLELASALELPTFEFEGTELIKRLTLIVEDGVISRVFYPVFPPDRHAAEVVRWLDERR